nr:hypothetical protein [Tanacetum cinerariifolium]
MALRDCVRPLWVLVQMVVVLEIYIYAFHFEGAEEPKTVEVEPECPVEPTPSTAVADVHTAEVEEKAIIPVEPIEEKPVVVDDSKAIVPVEKPAETVEEKPSEGSVNRDAVLARVSTEKKDALIRAWEESEKSKAENKNMCFDSARKSLYSLGLMITSAVIKNVSNFGNFALGEYCGLKCLFYFPEPAETVEEKPSEGSVNRDAVLARVSTEKKDALIRAWEESEKSKAENKAQQKLSSIVAWENSKKADIEADVKKIEEALDKKKAKYVEKMKNKIALLHKTAEEKRANTEAKLGEDLLKAEETAAKCRATGAVPKKGWFSS